jgi:hypothetical protein
MGVISQLSVPLTLMTINHRVGKKRHTNRHTKRHTKHHTKRQSKRTRAKKSKFIKKRR